MLQNGSMMKINKKQHEHDEINKQERHNPTTYRRVDELTMIFSTTEEINTLLIKAVSGYDSAVDLDREANIQGCYLRGEDVYCSMLQCKYRSPFLKDSASVSHWTKGR
jgi:hypothetical protein